MQEDNLRQINFAIKAILNAAFLFSKIHFENKYKGIG